LSGYLTADIGSGWSRPHRRDQPRRIDQAAPALLAPLAAGHVAAIRPN
jgi:hypothetical protein